MPRIVPGPVNPSKPYSPATVSSGRLVWTAGQVGYRPDGSVPDTLEEQVQRAMANLLAALAEAGASESDVVAVNVFIAHSDDFDAMNDLYRRYFTAPLPARTTTTTGLRPNVLFEINAVAAI